MKIRALSIIVIMLLTNVFVLFTTPVFADDQPQWPSSWILIDTDQDEDTGGIQNDYRDVGNAYYRLNNDYLYLRFECYGYPNFYLNPDGRYKWYIDIDDPHNMIWSGGNVFEAEYLFFIEDTDNDGDGDIYLLNDRNSDGNFKEWEKPPNYWYDRLITDINIANYSIYENNLYLWIKLTNISDPDHAYFTWSTDNENSNVDQASSLDRSDVFEADLSKADLSVVKYDNPDPIPPGELLTYTLYITNHGPHNAININVTDILPTEVSFVNANPAPLSNIDSTYWWIYSSLNKGESKIITINVTVGAIGNITNNANVYSDIYDPILGNNEYIEETLIAIGTTFNLIINIEGSGSVAKDPDQTTYLPGTITNLTAVGSPGWSFDYWSGDLSGSNNPQSILMNDNKTVTAHFTQDQYTLTVNIDGNGSVVIDPDQSTYLYGTMVSLTANGDLGWNFSHWSGDLSGSDTEESIIMDGDKTVNAYFTEDQYTLNIIIDGSGYVVNNPNQSSYTYGTIVQLTAVANSGWTFNHWSGAINDTLNPATINMTNSKSVTVYFSKSSVGGGGSGGGGTGDVIDLLPTADANGPYFANKGEEITYDGTGSHDNDEAGESIVRYDWKFFDGDNWNIDLGVSPKYIYNEAGIYNVSLRVVDDEGSSAINTTITTIYQPNLPPTILNIIGEVNGHQNISYPYNISAFDPDGDNITYTVNWGDGNSDVSSLISDEMPYIVYHMWNAPGDYAVTAYATDEQDSQSDEKVIHVLIDIHYVKDIGYLIDEDSDGIFDQFFSNKTNKVTVTEKQNDGRYLINDNDDDLWDWVYDPDTDTLEVYYYEEADFTLWYILLILLLICLIVLLLLLYKRRKKKETPADTTGQP